jgi:hypothetical protein
MRLLAVVAVLVLVAQMLALPVAFSQDKKKDGGKKTTTLDFEDELVEGEYKKPELFYLLQRKQFNFKRLIKLRKDFIPEMKQTYHEVNTAEGSK